MEDEFQWQNFLVLEMSVNMHLHKTRRWVFIAKSKELCAVQFFPHCLCPFITSGCLYCRVLYSKAFFFSREQAEKKDQNYCDPLGSELIHAMQNNEKFVYATMLSLVT